MAHSNKIQLVFLLAGLVVLGSPAMAQNGADDPVTHDSSGGTNGSGSSYGGGSGGSGTDDPAGHVSGSGLDDPAGDDRGHGVGLEPGDDHGVHEVSVPDDNQSPGIQRRKVQDNSDDDLKIKGTLIHTVRKHGERESFDMRVKIPCCKASLGMASQEDARNAAVFGTFRDEAGTARSECRFEFDEKDGKNLEYRVKASRTGSTLREKDGACDIDLSNGVADPGIPASAGGAVDIYVQTAAGKQSIARIRY